MDIIRNKMDEHRYNIELIDYKEDIIQIEYGGADLYWTMLNYYEDNLFKITKEDKFLFSQMNQLFKQIEKYDNQYNRVLKNNCFEWISEAYGLPEEANKLIIKKTDESFAINFFNNPNHLFGIKDICCVCFCLSGSSNQEIACAFSNMFLEYKTFEDTSIIKKIKK